jgi:hypothetical protein
MKLLGYKINYRAILKLFNYQHTIEYAAQTDSIFMYICLKITRIIDVILLVKY